MSTLAILYAEWCSFQTRFGISEKDLILMFGVGGFSDYYRFRALADYGEICLELNNFYQPTFLPDICYPEQASEQYEMERRSGQ